LRNGETALLSAPKGGGRRRVTIAPAGAAATHYVTSRSHLRLWSNSVDGPE